MKYKQIWKTAAACLMAAAMLPGCSDEEGGGTVNPEDKYRTLEITINSKNNAEPVGTRADNDDTEDLGNYEHYIDEYWLIVTKRNEQGQFLVDRVISSDDVDVYSQPNNDHDDSETSLSMEVEIGQTYRFYALANLDYLQNGESVISEIEGLVGKEFDPASLNVQVQPMENYKDQTYIPMTSYGYEQEIKEGTTQLVDASGNPESIELIRLIGKVTLNVTNLTGETITLNGLSMGKFRTIGSIYLFPYDIANDTRNLLNDNMAEYLNPSFPKVAEETPDFFPTIFVGETTSPKPEILNGEDNAQSFTAYVNETGNGNGDFTITSVIPGRNNDPINSGFSFVRRNDWLQLPIQITDVDVTIDFDQQHMPIGGTPGSVNIPEGAQIPIGTCITEHGGDITVTFTLNSVSSMENAYLSFYSGSDWMSGTQFTDAILISNTSDADNEEPILINLPAAGNTNVPWEATDVVAFPITYTGEQPTSGSFTVTAQELAESTTGRAEIELTLVITNGTQEMAIPYTIVITNKTTN